MYWEIFLADFTLFCVFGGISQDFAEIPEFRGSATTRNIRSPGFSYTNTVFQLIFLTFVYRFIGLCANVLNLNIDIVHCL